MGLGWIKIDVWYMRAEREKYPSTGATTRMDRWPYHEFEITWYMPPLSDLKDDELEEVVVHELCHILLAPLSIIKESDAADKEADIMEWTTTLVQKAMMWVREEDKPKKKGSNAKS